jgi:hypothetical protein
VFSMTLKGISVDDPNSDAAKAMFKDMALKALPFNNYPPEQINVELIPIYGRRRSLLGVVLGYIVKYTLTESAFIPVSQISSALEGPAFMSDLVQVGVRGGGGWVARQDGRSCWGVWTACLPALLPVLSEKTPQRKVRPFCRPSQTPPALRPGGRSPSCLWPWRPTAPATRPSWAPLGVRRRGKRRRPLVAALTGRRQDRCAHVLAHLPNRRARSQRLPAAQANSRAPCLAHATQARRPRARRPTTPATAARRRWCRSRSSRAVRLGAPPRPLQTPPPPASR